MFIKAKAPNLRFEDFKKLDAKNGLIAKVSLTFGPSSTYRYSSSIIRLIKRCGKEFQQCFRAILGDVKETVEFAAAWLTCNSAPKKTVP